MENKPETETTEEVVELNNGATRAAKRLEELRVWQEGFYANAEPFSPTRQNKRWMSRFIAKKQAANERAKMIRERRRKTKAA